jgi:polyhydroxyalkanoate synthesis regulator phasin
MSFLSEHVLEIIFGLISAGALAFCRYLCKQIKEYKKLLGDQETHKIENLIDDRLEPILHELEILRKSLREESSTE